jgi:SAM-dependent methyltransferase
MYRLRVIMSLNEAQAKEALKKLIDKYNKLTTDEKREMSEATVVRQFVDILLRDVLGWPIEDTARYRYEQVTQVGRPDMMLTPEHGGTIFVEAKRFGIIKELELSRTDIRGVITPGQLALPGMAVDRTPEEQQAINYAFKNNGTWAILSNFERLRLFNARRDWLVLSFERPGAYLSDFDALWQLAYHNVINGSLEALSNQRHTAEVDTEYLKFINDWREQLAQDIVQNPDKNRWVLRPDGEIDLPVLRSVVQRVIDRLVIARYAEDHWVLTPGTMRSFYELRESNAYADLHQMMRTFFRRFDEQHNSALFAEGLADQVMISDPVMIALLKKLYEARYRSMPPDIMGNTYEQYLGKTLVRRNGSIATADNLETRKKQGSYYTPQVIVRYIVDNSLGRYLYATENGKSDGTPIAGESRKTSDQIKDLRVLDSACGSGSFLIYAYQVLDQFYESEKERIDNERKAKYAELVKQGLTDPFSLEIQLTPYKAELDRIENHRRLILETHLYGVDLDPQAAEIAVINLMMRGMERMGNTAMKDKLLPLILNQNVKVGNSLVGLRPDDPHLADCADQIAAVRKLRADLLRIPHTDPDHDRVIRDLEQVSATLNEALNGHFKTHFDDLTAVRPFHWAAEFPEVFVDEHGQPLENPGFAVIFGNPPWEILKPDLREFYAQFDPDIESRLNRAQAETRIVQLDAEDPRRREAYAVSMKNVERLSAYVRSSNHYTRQGRGDVATHKLFTERMYTLLKHEGRLGYVVPSGIYTDLGTKELREMLLNEGNIQYIFGFSNERYFFPGVHHAFKFTMIGAQKGPQSDGFWSVFRFNPRVAVKPEELPEFVGNQENLIYVTRDSLEKFSPDTLSMMEFQSKKAYVIAEKIYGNWPLLSESNHGWSVKFTNEFHMTNDSYLFNTVGDGFPLYEGKMFHQFNAYFASPRFWIDEQKGRERLIGKGVESSHQSLNYQRPRLVYRDITGTTNERTFIAAIIPPNVFVGNTGVIETQTDGQEMLFLLSILNSYCNDFLIRYKVSSHVSMFYAYQLPMPRLVAGDPYFDAIVPRAARLTCTRPEFADLWQQVTGTAWDESSGATDPAARQQLRNEIDALVARLYSLTRDEFDHILGTFPLVFPDTAEGQRKRAALLATFDATEIK